VSCAWGPRRWPFRRDQFDPEVTSHRQSDPSVHCQRPNGSGQQRRASTKHGSTGYPVMTRTGPRGARPRATVSGPAALTRAGQARSADPPRQLIWRVPRGPSFNRLGILERTLKSPNVRAPTSLSTLFPPDRDAVPLTGSMPRRPFHVLPEQPQCGELVGIMATRTPARSPALRIYAGQGHIDWAPAVGLEPTACRLTEGLYRRKQSAPADHRRPA